MTTQQPFQNSYDLAKNSYVAFDALSLRQLIVDRLNKQGTFTDQNFIGSNLAAINDIVAFTFNALIYYLNNTATESLFSEAQLYENMNRIVKLIDYSPIGVQTSTMSFNCSASNLSRGWYTIPRYSFILINNIPFSFNEDLVFAKTTDSITESLNELSQQKLLFQGLFTEYPLYIASGVANEVLTLDVANQLVDHFNINVYVKSQQTGKWRQFIKTPNMYLENSDAEKYEIRLNENNRYEIKFGNNINGKQLTQNDEVAVYYLVSSGNKGEVAANTIRPGTSIQLYSTIQYNQILLDTNTNNYRYLVQSEMPSILLQNPSTSTLFQQKETVDDIRTNAPTNFKSQYRLVTTSDFESFIKSNYSYLFTDVKIINNRQYCFEYIKYFYDTGLTDPVGTDRALFNQLQYADNCNFNNIYAILVPKTTNTGDALLYLQPAQKELIKTAVQPVKIATTELTFVDPVYKSVHFGTDNTNGYLVLVKSTNSQRDDGSIISDAAGIMKQYFEKRNIKLGQTLDIQLLTQQLLSIKDVVSLYTTNQTNTIKIPGLSFALYNEAYPERDFAVVQNNINTKFFEYLNFKYQDDINTYLQVSDKPLN